MPIFDQTPRKIDQSQNHENHYIQLLKGFVSWLLIIIVFSIFINLIEKQVNHENTFGFLFAIFRFSFGITQGLIGGFIGLLLLSMPERQNIGAGIILACFVNFAIYYKYFK